MDRWRVVGFVLCLLGGGVVRPALAARVGIDVARAFDHAQLAGEVEVLEVRYATWRGFGDAGSVRVRVTSDPCRIFRGHELLGHTLDLSPCALGQQSCTAELARHVDDRELLLLVTDAKGGIVLAGARQGEGYRLRTWSDYAEVGLRAPWDSSRAIEAAARVDVPRATLDRRFRRARREFWGRVSRFLSQEKPSADPAELERWIAQLSDAEPGRRQQAQRWIREHAPLRIAELRAAMATAPDPEARRNLGELLAGLRDFARAYDLAREFEVVPPATRAAVVREGLPALAGYPRACADAYLRGLSEAGRRRIRPAPR